MKRHFVDCGETIKLERIKEDMNIENSADGPHKILHNEELLFIGLIGSDLKRIILRRKEFYYFEISFYFSTINSFLYFSIIFYLNNVT